MPQENTINTTTTTPTSGLVKPTAEITNSFKNFFNKLFFSSDIGLLIFLIGIFLFAGLGLVLLFELGVPNIRGQIVNNVVGFGLAAGFIILIFSYMGKSVTLFGKKFDVGLLYYLSGLILIMFLFCS